MRARTVMTSVAAFSVAQLVASAGASVVPNGGIVFEDEAAFEQAAAPAFWTGLEGLTAGDAVTTLDFGDGLIAEVVSDAPFNRVISGRDGYGAIAHEGDLFWKLARGSTTLDFGNQQLDAFGFWFSDKESATVMVSFDNGDSFELTRRNPNRTDFFGYQAGDAGSFSWVTFSWLTNNNDGVGFDNFSAVVIPSPGVPVAVLAAAGMVVMRRRR